MDGRAPVPQGLPGPGRLAQHVLAAGLPEAQPPRRRRLISGLFRLVEKAGELRGTKQRKGRSCWVFPSPAELRGAMWGGTGRSTRQVRHAQGSLSLGPETA